MKTRQRRQLRTVGGEEVSPAPIASAGTDASQSGQAWELVKIAYDEHFELARHYSSVMFQARIAITTVMVLAVALCFGYLPTGGSDQIEFQQIPARGLVAYVAAWLINLLHAMEVTYMVRFYRIIRSGRTIEAQHRAPAYFTNYLRAASWPLYIAYLVGIVLLVGLFIGAAWLPGQEPLRSVALLVAASLPAAMFARSYVQLVRSGRRLFESNGPA